MTRMKLTQILAATLVAAASVPAVASIALPNTGNGELFLVMWDQVDTVSYTKDLGIRMDSFDKNAPLSFALNDDKFAGFLAVANTTASDIKFAVMAGDSTGTRRIFSTVDNAATPLNNQQLTNSTGWMNTYANNQVTVSANTTHAGGIDVNGTSFDVAPNQAYFGAQNGATFQNNASGWTNSSLVGSQAMFRSFTSDGTAGGRQTLRSDLAFMRVSESPNGYTLSVSAVPEPGSIAMMLAGLGAVGWIARRRRIG